MAGNARGTQNDTEEKLQNMDYFVDVWCDYIINQRGVEIRTSK